MKRRDLLIASAAAITLGYARADLPKVRSLDEALSWLVKLGKAADAKTTGEWPLVAVLEHMSQSVEMSMDGFPKPSSALFQNTAGSAAFGFFKWRGRMSHSLSEPIPGAAALSPAGDWRAASARLASALSRFKAHQGPLQPHFAYGLLDKDDFAQAHVMHIANHQDEILLAQAGA